MRQTDQFSTRNPQASAVRVASVARVALLVLWTLVCLLPLLWVVITSFKGEMDIMDGPRFLPFIDFMPSLESWLFVLTDPSNALVPRAVNSTVIGLTSTALTLLIGWMAVYAITRFGDLLPGIGNNGLLLTLLATRILPPIILVLPIYLMAKVTNLLDTRTSLIIAYTASNLPVAIWLLRPILGLKRSDIEEAALLDGASHWSIAFTILAPIAARAIAAVGLLIFMLCWNEYLFAAYLAGDRAMTLPPFLVGQMSIKEAQVGGDGQEWAQFSAATMLMVVPLLACSTVVQRALGRLGGRT
jgi:multiple sugar transport system permease protein